MHGLSIDAQLAALREAYPNGQEYVDLGISARKPISKRPELQRLLRDVEQNKIDLIVFTKLDRWTRNIREYYKAQDVLDSHHVAWKALWEDYETQTAAGVLKTNIMLAVSQDEALRTSERIKAVFERKRQNGLVPTGSVPLGIRIVDGHYAPSEDAEKVRDIFRHYIASRSPSDTAREFKMTANGVRYLLRNKTYLDAGVVDSTTYNTAQEILKQRSQRNTRSDRVYLFSGLLVCPYCGAKLTCVRVSGHTYYRCPRHYDGSCPGYHTSEIKVEKYMVAQLVPHIKNVNLHIRHKKKKPIDVAALKRKRDKLTDLYMEDLISKDKYEQEYKVLQNAIDDAEREQKPIDTVVIKTALEAYKGLSDGGKKAFWSNLINTITPTENGFDFTINYT